MHPLVCKIRKNIIHLQKRGVQLRLFWVRAHTGTPGNERADQLAKRAALYKKTRADYGSYPLSYVKRTIRQESITLWCERYAKDLQNKHILYFLPDGQAAFSYARSCRPDRLLTQMLTGHGGFGQYLHRMKLRDSPWCLCEPGTVEDVVHILTECPKYGKLRHDLENEIRTDIQIENLNSLFNVDPHKEIFKKFCRIVVSRACTGNGSTIKWLDLN